MGAPTTTALLLAALAALPCRGTNTDPVPADVNEAATKGHPFVNKVYQMLFTNTPLDNHAFQTNYNKTTSNFIDNSQLDVTFESTSNYSNVCCGDAQSVNNTISNGAEVEVKNVVNEKKNRRRRVVKIDTGNREEITVRVTTVILNATAPAPVYVDRRRKPGEAGTSTQLLNYIFDTYTNTHHHKNVRVGPGNGIYAAAAPEIEALTGSVAHLDCKVDALHDKLVSWVRRKNDDEAMELLTTGTQQYTADDRYSARFIPPDIWRLEIKDVRPSDAAHYDCHLSAHPPRTARITLLVPEVSVRIVDGAGADVSEQVCELGSTVALRCEVNGLKMEGGPSLLWYRRDYLLNDDTLRGGISVRTVFGQNGASSVLKVARVRSDDAGQYACAVARAPPPAPPPAHVMLHVIKGESLAELHQGGSAMSSTVYLPAVVAAMWCANFIAQVVY